MARRLGGNALRLLSIFYEEPERPHYGLELSRAAGIGSGSLYPLLDRLERDGHLTAEWEDINESAEGRRKRRYYMLTPTGRIWVEGQLRETADGLARLRLGGAW